MPTEEPSLPTLPGGGRALFTLESKAGAIRAIACSPAGKSAGKLPKEAQ